MCGRYSLSSAGEVVGEVFELDEAPDFEPRYNISPGREAPVVRSLYGKRELVPMHWGFAPARKGGRFLINARSETVTEKPSFKEGFEERRCLVPANGFYEWRKNGQLRAPYFIKVRDHELFGMAGVWRRQLDGEEARASYVVLTTIANRLVAGIHDRMPVILHPDDYGAWLDPESDDRSELLKLLRPLDPDWMETYPVSSFVNSAINEGERCIERVEEAPIQQSLF